MPIVDLFKGILDNRVVNGAAFISTAVLAGYCLQPVPEVVSKAFDTSYVLKFFVLLIMSVIALQPKDDYHLGLIAIVIVVLFIALDQFREVHDKVEVKAFEDFKNIQRPQPNR